MNNLKKQLIQKLKKKHKNNFKIALMPHFCVDNFVQYGKNFNTFVNDLKKIEERGGGSLIVRQVQRRGGKAANVASGLSSLEMKPSLIVKTNKQGLDLLKGFFEKKKIDLSHVATNGTLGFTTAIEINHTNIMINDPGTLTNFGPDYLTSKDRSFIKSSNLTVISDWSPNKKGNELAKAVFSLAKKGKTFFDPGDSATKGKKEKEEIEKMRNTVLKKGLIDIFAGSEEELKKYGQNKNTKKAIENLREHACVCLHNSNYAKLFTANNESKKIPAFNVAPLRLTGAGDSWNAGFLFGELIGLDAEEKLLLGHAVAGYYISSEDAEHPNIKELIKFIEKTPLKKPNNITM